MQPYFRHAVVALVLLAGTGAASAQMPLTRHAVDATAVDTTVIEALQQVRTQRTMSYRTSSAPRVSKLPGLRKFPSQITVRRGLTNSLR